MKSQLKFMKTAFLVAVLPFAVTAAVSATQLLSDTAPLTVELDGVTATKAQLGADRVHTVALNQAGAVEGRIATINAGSKEAAGLAELKVYFIQNGEVIYQAQTDADGAFAVEDVAEGAYSFVATGENGFAAYGVRVVANDGTDQVNFMEAAAVSPRFEVVKQILDAKLPEEVANQIIEDSSEVTGAQVVGANRVQLENGKLTGRVLPLVGDVDAVAGTYVHILKSDEQIAEVQADEAGNFEIADLEPGVYNFVAAGPTGFRGCQL